MKKIFFFIAVISMPLFSFAQTPKNLQKEMDQARKEMEQLKSNPQFQQAMQKAQQAMQKMKSDTALQRQIKQSQVALDSSKKTNPALSNMQIPDLSKMQIPQLPNFDSIEQTMNKASEQIKTESKALAQTVIAPNPLHHAGQLQKLSQSALTALANAFIKQIKSGLKPNDLHNLNGMLKNKKINIPGTGAFLLASGGNTSAALFLICNGILKNPKNPWAVNDLGVYYRDQKNYEKALQCYLYADKLDNEKNTAINTNIGWTAAYYGDLITAKKYFDKALAIDPNFRAANEGEAMIAYAQGNLAALFQCLAKEITGLSYAGGASGDAGPSDAFASFSSNLMAENEGNLDNQTTDPSTDHTFDNPNNNDEGSSQGPPPGADVDQVSFPGLKKVFINDPRQIWDAVAQYLLWGRKEGNVFKQKINSLQADKRSLKPLVQPPHIINGVAVFYPLGFRKYVELFEEVGISMDKREGWYANKLDKRLESLRKEVVNHDNDMQQQYNKALLGCLKLNGPAKDACYRQVNCTWIPKMYGSKNRDLEAIAEIWDDYYNHMVHTINWYINATVPFVSRVHEENWNRYLNDERKFEAWTALFKTYGEWGAALSDINSPVDIIIKQPAPSCAPVEVAGVAHDPYSKPPKHIKEFVDTNCFDITSHAWGTGISAEQTCHGTTISFGTSNIGFNYSHVDDPIYAQNHGYTNQVGANFSVDESVDIEKLESGEDAEGNSKEMTPLSAGVDVNASVTLNFDNNWGFQSGSSSIGASAGITGSLGVNSKGKGKNGEDEDKYNPLGTTDYNIGFGISATRTVEMVAGQLQVNPLEVTGSTPFGSKQIYKTNYGSTQTNNNQ